MDTMIDRFMKLLTAISKAIIDLNMKFNINEEDFELLKNLSSALKPVRLCAEALGRRDANLLSAKGAIQFAFNELNKSDCEISSEILEAF